MGWKPEFKLGNDLIDAQHEELFVRVEALAKIIESEDAASQKQECIDAILFLKDYAVRHFTAEEEYQQSRNYPYFEFHKAIHSSFISSVLEAEEQLVASDFSVPAIKEFCGFLSMWLIYHVAGADQKIKSNEVLSVAEFAMAVSYEECIVETLKDVLNTILGETSDVAEAEGGGTDDNAVKVETEYDETRNMSFAMSKETALKLVNTITDLNLTEVDELAYAALTQLGKTISGTALSHMNKQATISDDAFYISTKFGNLAVSLYKK